MAYNIVLSIPGYRGMLVYINLWTANYNWHKTKQFALLKGWTQEQV